MRRVLLDEGVPIGVRSLFIGFRVDTAAELGWAGLANGDLIEAAEQAGFDVMLTADQNISYQQNMTGRRLA
jgi:alkanesulfonate monooxygenase SsuD/methylene tetrahydromethanopterin reductase-like flavin-dependent oxidoreductase (luciferase family)